MDKALRIVLLSILSWVFVAGSVGAAPILSDSGVNWTLVANSGGTASDSTANFTLTASGDTANNWWIYGVELKDFGSVNNEFTISNLVVSASGPWASGIGGVSGSACSGSPAKAKCIYDQDAAPGTTTNLSASIFGIFSYTWTFDVTLSSGLFTNNSVHFKHFLTDGTLQNQTSDEYSKKGSLISANLDWTFVDCDPSDPSCNPSEISEPATIALLGLGLIGLGFARRRRTI